MLGGTNMQHLGRRCVCVSMCVNRCRRRERDLSVLLAYCGKCSLSIINILPPTTSKGDASVLV